MLEFQFVIITVYFLLIAAASGNIYVHADIQDMRANGEEENNNFFSIESSSGFLRDLSECYSVSGRRYTNRMENEMRDE